MDPDSCSDGCCRYATDRSACWECVPGTTCFTTPPVSKRTYCCEPDGPVIDPPVCDSNPGAPSLTSPADGSTIIDDNSITFNWSANGWGGANCDSRGFRLEVDNNSDFSSPEYAEGGIASGTTSRTVDFDQPENTYYWRVSASNDRPASRWSPTWSFDLDYVPPTAEFTSPTTDITIAPNNLLTFEAQASDPGGALTFMHIFRYNTADAVPPNPRSAPAIQLGLNEGCAGANCSLTRWWTPTDADIGTWEVYVNAFDENEVAAAAGGRCTGSNDIPGWWSDCDTGNNPDLITVTVQNTPPVVRSVLGPTTANQTGIPGATIASYTNLYNTAYDDIDKQVVTSTWSSPNCPFNYEEIDHIVIRSFGDFGVGAWPIMEVEVGDPFGASYGDRRTACTFTVDSGSWQNRTCNINQRVSSLDILFQNDASGGAGDDRNLYLDWIDIYYTDGSRDRVQAEDRNTSGNFVWIDRGTGVEAYDGLTRENANQTIPWNAAVRFPVPISFSPPSVPATCRLQATPRDSLGAVGNTRFRDVTVCGAAPTAVTNPSPPSGEENVLMPVTTTWDAPTDWGDACGLQINTYTVYAKLKTNLNCLPADPIGTVHGTGTYNPVGWPTSTCIGLAEGNESCSDPFFNLRDADFCWYVEANNNQFTSQSEVWWFETYDPITYQEWMTVLYGDFYAGSVNMEFPEKLNYEFPNPSIIWNPPHLSYERDPGDPDTTNVCTLASSDIDIEVDSSFDYGGSIPPAASQSELYAKYANFAPNQTWPANYNGEAPASAISLPRSGEDCKNIFIHDASEDSPALSPKEAYVADVGCVNDGLQEHGDDYVTKNSGVVVLYVSGDGSEDLRFDKNFLTSQGPDHYRFLFVTGPDVDVKIDRDLDSGDPDFNSTPLIEASFLVVKNIEFEGVAPGDEETDEDTSVVVEGPIITKSALFSRNRGLGNAYPSEIIIYNGDYLPTLTMAERDPDNDSSNFSGLFIVDVDWISEE
ncbi:carbohydrate-binding domain-containing protein [Patescibacteria group bacterium]